MNELPSSSHGESVGSNKFTRELEELSSALIPENIATPSEISVPAPVEQSDSAELDEDAYLEQLYSRSEFRERQARIGVARQAGNKTEESRLVGEQSNFVETKMNARRAVTGETASVAGSIVRSEEIRKARLSAVVDGLTGTETDEEILKKFEIMNDKNEVQLDSPLFHTVTRRAFEMYMKTVAGFDGLSYVERQTGTRVKGIGKADQDRSIMHDLTAELVSNDLGMDFDVSRRLVAKVREAKVPGSNEQQLYGISARRAIKTAEQYGYDVGTWADDQLESFKRAIERLKDNELTSKRN